MTDFLTNTLQYRTLRLDTLTRLRWLAVGGQVAAVIGVYWGLGFPLPIAWALAVITISACLNIVLRLRYPSTERLNPARAASLLAFDIFQLAILLYLTGGLQNPFSFLFLAPVMISATSLPPKLTLALGLLAIGCATALTTWHLPLPWYPTEALAMPLLYVIGMWASVLLGLAFIGVYAWRVADEARLLSEALAATELVLAREHHLSQLDGLAAAAAHELGTPLATIALVAKELEVFLAKTPIKREDLSEDLQLLRSQVERCREILSKLTSLGENQDVPFDRVSRSHLIEDAVAPHRSFGIEIEVSLKGEPPEPSLWRNPGLLYGLGNFMENAVDFATSRVEIDVAWTAHTVSIAIIDDGPGFPPEIVGRLGEPYLTLRRFHLSPGVGGGLGLGVFIAKTLLERSGAAIGLGNRGVPQNGARVELTWPRDVFEKQREPAVISNL